MPFRSKVTLQQWLESFAESRAEGASPFVAAQEESEGSDSGLIVFPLQTATTSVYLQPTDIGAPQWRVTFEPRSEIAELRSGQVRQLAADLLRAADLCDYLEQRSLDHLENPTTAAE